MCGLLGDYLTAPKKINVNHESNRVCWFMIAIATDSATGPFLDCII